MADLQLVSDDLGELQRQAENLPLTKIKRRLAKTFSACVAVPVWPERCGGLYGTRTRSRQYDNDIYAQYHKIMAWLGTCLPI